MIIKGAAARIKEVETGGLFRGRKELLAHLNGDKTILSEAVMAKCYDCMGYYSDGRQDCACPLCSLYPFNPYNPNKRKRKSPMTDEQKQQAAAPSFSEFVFTHNGRNAYDEKILNKIWREACDAAGVKIKLYNGLRHSRAGQLLDAKYPIELVSELLGHSKIQMTRDMYGRISETRITEALENVRILPFTANLPTKNQEIN